MDNIITKSLSVLLMMTLYIISVPAFANPKDCMAKAMYFEARGGTEKDILAVGHTIMNRVRSNSFPNNVCKVTTQRSQFSPLINRGASIADRVAYNKCKAYADKVISGQSKDFTQGATYFHNRTVKPRWSYRFQQVYSNRQHIFYKP